MPKETWDIKKKCVLILNGVRATVQRKDYDSLNFGAESPSCYLLLKTNNQ